MNTIISQETRLKIATTILKGESTLVMNNITGEIKSFVSSRKAAEFIGIHQSYLAKSFVKNKFYLGRGFLVYKSSTDFEEIINCEAYKEAIAESDDLTKTKSRHTQASKELIRKANLGKKLSLETKLKLASNSKNAKPVLVINNETKETMEFSSNVSAAKFMGVDESYIRVCIKKNKACKGYTVVRKSEN